MKDIKYPIGIQTFADIINGGYIYVDKTAHVWRLVSRGKYYFLSRPRRFGKSLLLSTIEAFFQGRKELFKGLYIYDQDWAWEEYPIFHLALNGQNYNSIRDIDEVLHNSMGVWEQQYGLKVGDSSKSVSTRFFNCIYNAYKKTGHQVVILVDEYDQPLFQNIEQGKDALHKEMREHLHAFYSVIKAQDQYICFGMLTGISKFSKVSVFSGLNNLNDISIDANTNSICGISETELTENFSEGIVQFAEANGMTEEEAKAGLKREYDGYHFSKQGEGIYNPFSLLNAFDKKDFRHYWMETGTPSFLIKLLGDRDWNLSEISGATVSESSIMGSDMYMKNPIPMLLQSGYLTIKGYDAEFREFTVDFPNEEVSEGFNEEILKSYSGHNEPDTLIRRFVKDVRKGEAESFMESIQVLLSDIPYDQILDRELHYENMMYLVMKLMGFYVRTEYRTSRGRIDMVISTDKYIYVMEFKLHGTSEEALSQIRERGYAKPFMNEGKRIILVGAAFDDVKRNLDSWVIERL